MNVDIPSYENISGVIKIERNIFLLLCFRIFFIRIHPCNNLNIGTDTNVRTILHDIYLLEQAIHTYFLAFFTKKKLHVLYMRYLLYDLSVKQ